MLCKIWYHLYNLIKVKKTHGESAILLKVTLLHGCYSRFSNCTTGTKSCKAPHIIILYVIHEYTSLKQE